MQTYERMKTMKKLMMLLLSLCLVFSLAACGQNKDQTGSDTKEETNQEETAGDTAKTPDAENPDAETPADDQSGEEAVGEHTISGIVNKLEDYLVLLDADGEYHIFDYGIDVDPTTLAEGDKVTVSYNGTLDDEKETPVAVSIDKTES